jgi:hypothetical protein
MATTQLEAFEVTLDVLVPAGYGPDARQRLLGSLHDTLTPAMDRLGTGCELAESLGLPAAVPVRFHLGIAEDPQAEPAGDALPVRAAFSGGPELTEERFDTVADALGDLLYEAVHPLRAPAEALGGRPGATVPVELRFGADAARVTGPGTIHQYYCDAGYYSWSKGCSSWPF